MVDEMQGWQFANATQDGRDGFAASLGETASASARRIWHSASRSADPAEGSEASAEGVAEMPEGAAAAMREDGRLAGLSPAARRELKEVLPTLQRLNEIYDAEAREQHGPWGQLWLFLSALGGGTGARFGKSGVYVNRDLAHRVQLQDEAVLLLLLFVYYSTLAFSCSVTYRQSKNSSSVTFYADQRFHTASIENYDAETFLEAFNQPPKNIVLKVTGYSTSPTDAPGSIAWGGSSYFIDFNFALDLSTWVVRDTREAPIEALHPDGAAGAADGGDDWNDGGVWGADLVDLRRFLARGSSGSDMTIIAMSKEVRWISWEELATNIKHQIRQRGYTGAIGIERTESDTMHVYKNTQWANFMHSKALKVILALSVFGWIAYLPYMWLRCNTIRVRSAHRVAIAIDDYWRLIAEHLSADGFDASPAASDAADSATPPDPRTSR